MGAASSKFISLLFTFIYETEGAGKAEIRKEGRIPDSRQSYILTNWCFLKSHLRVILLTENNTLKHLTLKYHQQKLFSVLHLKLNPHDKVCSVSFAAVLS